MAGGGGRGGGGPQVERGHGLEEGAAAAAARRARQVVVGGPLEEVEGLGHGHVARRRVVEVPQQVLGLVVVEPLEQVVDAVDGGSGLVGGGHVGHCRYSGSCLLFFSLSLSFFLLFFSFLSFPSLCRLELFRGRMQVETRSRRVGYILKMDGEQCTQWVLWCMG